MITKGLGVILIVFLIYLSFDWIEINTGGNMEVIPQCTSEQSLLDCHYPKYKRLEK